MVALVKTRRLSLKTPRCGSTAAKNVTRVTPRALYDSPCYEV